MCVQTKATLGARTNELNCLLFIFCLYCFVGCSFSVWTVSPSASRVVRLSPRRMLSVLWIIYSGNSRCLAFLVPYIKLRQSGTWATNLHISPPHPPRVKAWCMLQHTVSQDSETNRPMQPELDVTAWRTHQNAFRWQASTLPTTYCSDSFSPNRFSDSSMAPCSLIHASDLSIHPHKTNCYSNPDLSGIVITPLQIEY